MSFSGNVKEELAAHISSARHCQLAELAALLKQAAEVELDAGEHRFILLTEEELEEYIINHGGNTQ